MKTNRQSAAKFMKKIMPCFRPPTNHDGSAADLMESYVGLLSEFDSAVLDQAAESILRTRSDPFFPTLAECLQACERIGTDARKAIADKQCTAEYARLRIANGTATVIDYRTLSLPVPLDVPIYPEYPGDPCER